MIIHNSNSATSMRYHQRAAPTRRNEQCHSEEDFCLSAFVISLRHLMRRGLPQLATKRKCCALAPPNSVLARATTSMSLMTLLLRFSATPIPCALSTRTSRLPSATSLPLLSSIISTQEFSFVTFLRTTATFAALLAYFFYIQPVIYFCYIQPFVYFSDINKFSDLQLSDLLTTKLAS